MTADRDAPKPSQEDRKRVVEWLNFGYENEQQGTLEDLHQARTNNVESLAALLATVRAEGLAAGQCCDPEAHEKIYQQGYADAIEVE